MTPLLILDIEVSILSWGYPPVLHFRLGFSMFINYINFGYSHLWNPPNIHNYVIYLLCYLFIYLFMQYIPL